MPKEGRENQLSPEEIERTNQERERVDAALRSNGNGGNGDAIHNLANRANEAIDLARRGELSKSADKFLESELKGEEEEKNSKTDKLTDLPNLRAYKENGPKFLSLEKRERRNCSLLVIDLDRLKEINDKYGRHAAGDAALKKIGDILKDKNILRLSDAAYRYAGDEFVVVLPGTDSSYATEVVAERIRKAIEEAEIVVTDEVKFHITVSIGCIGTDQLEGWDKSRHKIDSPKFLEKMFSDADLAAYESKRQGRNRVTLYSENLPEK